MAIDIDINEDLTKQVPAVVPIRFWKEYKENKDDPANPIPEDWVELAKRGSNGQTICDAVERVARNRMLWPTIERHYKAWQKGQEEPTEGTPLSIWPGIDRSLADHMRSLHIRTVEDIAALTDSDMDRVGMSALSLRHKARAFLDAGKTKSVVAKELAKRDSEIDDLKSQLTEALETIEVLAKKAGLKKRTLAGDEAPAEDDGEEVEAPRAGTKRPQQPPAPKRPRPKLAARR